MLESALILLIKSYSDRIEGVTFSGGEPMFQSAGLLALLQRIRRETRLSVLLYSGHTVEEIIARPHGEEILQLVDVLVSGRYDRTRRSNHSLVGSSDQKMHFLTSRYGTAEEWSEGEMFIDTEGMVMVSGVQVPFMQ